jgi:hypothetical protein
MIITTRATCPRCRGAGRLYPPDPIGDEAGEPCPWCSEDGYITLIEVTDIGSDVDGSVFFTTTDGEHHTYDRH